MTSAASSTFWSDACLAARDRTLASQIDSVTASCSVTVSAYCVSALACAAVFLRWWRMSAANKNRIWSLYGWFCGLTTFGSFVGIFTWIARMQQLVNNLQASELLSQTVQSRTYMGNDLFFSLSARWQAAFGVSYAVEFLCLSVAQVLVLDRMSDFAIAASTSSSGDQRRWMLWGRSVVGLIVLGNAVGLAGNIAAAPYFVRSSESSASAHSIFSDNNATLDLGRNMTRLAREQFDHAFTVSSVQFFCEVAVLLVIVCAFAVVGALCLRRISSIFRSVGLSLSNSKNAPNPAFATGRQVRKQIVVTTVFIFVSFMLRSVQSFMQALSSGLSDTWRSCPGNRVGLCNTECYNMWTHMFRWLGRTPEFQLTVVLISSPLALLVALWGMTSETALKLLRETQDSSDEVTL